MAPKLSVFNLAPSSGYKSSLFHPSMEKQEEIFIHFCLFQDSASQQQATNSEKARGSNSSHNVTVELLSVKRGY